ncbi:hypothetical protein UUA_09511 [Rhodanobacter thiooxydans LCS2]|nr:hypothetical protein UUA_09511 [Rhodanobacter thiooxydans LCS2]
MSLGGTKLFEFGGIECTRLSRKMLALEFGYPSQRRVRAHQRVKPLHVVDQFLKVPQGRTLGQAFDLVQRAFAGFSTGLKQSIQACFLVRCQTLGNRCEELAVDQRTDASCQAIEGTEGWQSDAVGDQLLDAHINQIRRVIHDGRSISHGSGRHIETAFLERPEIQVLPD